MGNEHKWAYDDLFAVVTADGEIWAVFAAREDADGYAAGGTFSDSDDPKVVSADVPSVWIPKGGAA
jgi:hypothetical protein